MMLNNIDFSAAYIDDILIKSKNKEEHTQHIKKVFEKNIKQYRLKLIIDKCELFLTKIKYLGQIINSKGRKPDPSRKSALQNMPIPTNVSELQAFLGLANYYGNFIPKMHVLRVPLNKLLRKDENCNWSNEE